MNRDDIIRMAREAGFFVSDDGDIESPSVQGDFDLTEHLERFASIVAADEREACCSGEVLNAANINGGDHPHQVIEKYQAAIRARGQA